MHSIKGGWVGQTFALAKCNESSGKKSRIRRSKEERKAMVESFIKKYQNSNNGNFPSLNLTHKEVGGSFYTIREIVREIIQENRVLGPGKLVEEEQNADQFFEQHPLGSISTGPQIPFPILSNGSHFVPNHYQGANYESVLVSNGLSVGSENHKVDNGQVINERLIDMRNENDKEVSDGELSEADKGGKELASTSFEVTHVTAEAEKNGKEVAPTISQVTLLTEAVESGEALPSTTSQVTLLTAEAEKSDKELALTTSQETQITPEAEKSGKVLASITSQVTEIAAEVEKIGKGLPTTSSKITQITSDVIVETFPLRPVAKPTECRDEKFVEARNLSKALEETETEKLDLGSENSCYPSEGTNSSDLFCSKAVKNLSSPLEESSNCFTTVESEVPETQNIAAVLEVDASRNNNLTSAPNEQSQAIAGKLLDAPNGIHPKTHGTYTGCAREDSAIQEKVENKVEVQHDTKPWKVNNRTLDRISLESWEGTSRNAAKPETNPLWAFFKSFIASFVKFWSE